MLLGTVLRNRYKILQKLGSGGFGQTYLAEDMDLPGDPKCVVKQLQTHNSKLEVLEIAKRLFNQEAEVLYRLGRRHDQIPELLAHFEENGEFYLVQEYIDGYDLTTEITPGKLLSEIGVVKLLREILEVLAAVHEHGVIHRDIKLQNIMRRQDGKIVLIDFGSVKQIQSLGANLEGEVNSTIVIGTPGYIPNEQANGKPRLCSDVYAVGMLGIQALTGVQPRKLPVDPVDGEVVWRDRVNVSDYLGDALTKMTRCNFKERYQTAAEALQALEISLPPSTIQGIPPKTKQAPQKYHSLLPKSSRSSGIKTVGLFSLLGVALGVVFLGGRFVEFNLQGTPATKTTNPLETIKTPPKTSPPTSRTKPNKNFINSPTISPSTPTPPSPSPVEQDKKQSNPVTEDKIKPSPLPPSEPQEDPLPWLIPSLTNKTESKPRPSSPPVQKEIPPPSAPVEEPTSKPSPPPETNEEESPPPSAPVEEPTSEPSPLFPSPETEEDKIPPSPSPETEGSTQSPTPTIEEPNNQMMVVPTTPTLEENNSGTMVVPTTTPTPSVEGNNIESMVVPTTPSVEGNNIESMVVPATPIVEENNTEIIAVPATPIVEENNTESMVVPQIIPNLEENNTEIIAVPDTTPSVDEISNQIVVSPFPSP